MAIRFELARTSTARVAFGYSPLLESVLSLHVLAEPKHHALQHEWVRAMRAAARAAAAGDRGARLPLPLDAPELRAARPRTTGYDELRGRARAASRACGPRSSPSSCCGRSTTTAAARGPRAGASCADPSVRARRAQACGPTPGRPRRARPHCSSTTRPRSSSASRRCSRPTGRRRSRRSGSGSSRGSPRASRSPAAQIAGDGIYAVPGRARAAAARRAGRHAASGSTCRTTTRSTIDVEQRRSCSSRASTCGRMSASTATRRGRSCSSTARRTSSRACGARRRPSS